MAAAGWRRRAAAERRFVTVKRDLRSGCPHAKRTPSTWGPFAVHQVYSARRAGNSVNESYSRPPLRQAQATVITACTGWVSGGTRTRFSELPAQCVDQLHHGHHDDRILEVVNSPAESPHLWTSENRPKTVRRDTTIAQHGAEQRVGSSLDTGNEQRRDERIE